MLSKILNHPILYIIAMFVGLGVYTNYVLKDILVESIRQETTKVINETNNDVKTKLTNNYKKIENLESTIQSSLPLVNKPTNEVIIPDGYSLVNDNRLSRRLKREKKECDCNVFH